MCFYQGNVGDEGGFAPDGITSPEEVIKIIAQAVDAAGYKGKISLGMDVAASEFCVRDGEKFEYNLNKWAPEKDQTPISSDELIEL